MAIINWPKKNLLKQAPPESCWYLRAEW